MTRPDPNSPDPGANQDDAVWLDLVARLEGTSRPEEEPEGKGGSAPARRPAAAKTFRDFDPLGLSVPAPVELSAKERLAPAPETPPAGAGVPETVPGPRDYELDDEGDGAFVPEAPPSLVGADPMTVLAWLGAVGGPVALVMSAMFWRSAPLMAILGMVAAFAASVVFLIMKLPGEKDDNDDGARV
jgi:hypothetical protein